MKRARTILTIHELTRQGRHDELRERLGVPELQIDKADVDGATALHVGASEGRAGCVSLLLEAGADHSLRWRGATPLLLAAREDHFAIMQLLLVHDAQLNARDQNDRTAIWYAVANGNVAAVRHLLDCGADVSVPDCDGNSPFHVAASDGDAEMLRALVEKRAVRLLANNKGETPLQCAISNTHHAIAEIMFDAADESAGIGLEGESLLHVAARAGIVSFVRRVLKRGAAVNAVNDLGQAALHVAAADNHRAVFELLLEGGASMALQNAEGETPLHVALHAKARDVLEVMVDLLSEDELRLTDAEQADQKGQTPLHIAAKLGNSDVTRALLAAGVGVDPADAEGRTPLHLAVEHGRSKTVSELLLGGAEVGRADSRGLTALDLAEIGEHRTLADQLRVPLQSKLNGGESGNGKRR